MKYQGRCFKRTRRLELQVTSSPGKGVEGEESQEDTLVIIVIAEKRLALETNCYSYLARSQLVGELQQTKKEPWVKSKLDTVRFPEMVELM